MQIINLQEMIKQKPDCPSYTCTRLWELNVAYPALERLGYQILRAGDYFDGTRIIVGWKRNKETWFIHGV